jgi:hypothetical protein
VFKPPEVANELWRVMVVQNEPRQNKNPRWKKLKVDESFDFDMPPGTRFRCLVTPVRFRPWENEISSHVIKWDLLRSIRCSNDGWNTYTEAVHGVSMGGKGENPTPTARQAELYLHDWLSGKRSEITLILRWEGPVTRPPRVVDD